MIKDGIYSAVIKSWKLTEKDDQFSIIVNFNVEVETGVYAPDPVAMWLTLSEQPAGQTGKTRAELSVETLRDLGFQGDDFSDLEVFPPPKTMHRVEVGSYTSKNGNAVQTIKLVRSMGEDKIKRLNANFGKLLRATRPKNSSEIPF